MKEINQFARKVAAIDNKMLESCPNKDKIWATQIGYALMLTFIVLFGITFYSMTIMHGGDILFDAETKSIKFDTQVIGVGEYVLYGVIAMIVALVVVLFDRAFYQSDWFMQAPYGVELGILKRVGFFLGKLLKVSIRIALSLFLAYTFSSFLELKVYESELLTSMQKKHFLENKELYADMDSFAQKLDDKERGLQEGGRKLLDKIQKLDSGVIVWSDDRTTTMFEKRKKELQKNHQQKLSSLSQEYISRKQIIKQEVTPYKLALQKKKKEYNELELKYQAEVGGLKEIEIGGKVIKASGIPTEGRRARIYKKRMQQLEGEIKSLRSKISNYDKAFSQLGKELTDKKEAMVMQLNQAKEQINIKLTEYQKKAQKGLLENAETIKEKLTVQLHRVQKQLEDIGQNKQHYIEEHYKEVIHSPEFIPFRDGPMSRLIAMEEMKKKPDLGKEIAYSSWFVKGILIFLEIAPILAKMLFGPPTVYATALQMQTKRATQRIVEEDGMSIDEIDELIVLEKKKRELIKERQDTMMKDLFHGRHQYNLKEMMKEEVQKEETLS